MSASRNNTPAPSINLELGQVVATAGIANAMLMHPEKHRPAIIACLSRHRMGDWGDVCPDDKKLNDEAVQYGSRVLSSYDGTPIGKVWIITEADRSLTTILYPEEY